MHSHFYLKNMVFEYIKLKNAKLNTFGLFISLLSKPVIFFQDNIIDSANKKSRIIYV